MATLSSRTLRPPRPLKRLCVCGCSSDEGLALGRKSPQAQIDGTDDLRLKELIVAANASDLQPHGLALVEDCARLLILNHRRRPTRQTVGIMHFVNQYCGVPGDAGYDYLVLSFLEVREDIMEHGCACRWGWLNGPLYEVVVHEDSKEAEAGAGVGVEPETVVEPNPESESDIPPPPTHRLGYLALERVETSPALARVVAWYDANARIL